VIDFHNHILPNLDDGSKSIEMSIEMLHEAAEQGITDVVNTVHFQHPKVDGVDISLEICQLKLEQLYNAMDKENISINIHLGAEVFYLPNLTNIVTSNLATFGNGKYMLIEFLTNRIPDSHKQVLFDLKMNGITPIIAHPERYKSVQSNISMVYRWLNAGCLIQIDAGSLTGSLGGSAQKAALEIVDRKLCQLLGSDAHDSRNRNFQLKEALDICKNRIGDEVFTWVRENPESILTGDPIHVKFNDEIVDKKNTISRIFGWGKFKS
jgi:protein-tyrosine phosphatase